ncbi:MAG TPA: FAD-binding oxidoreductase [Thermoplasmata archaeon]|nr:FAD-binding oxidoreductase [Thermoplasmata archaeon]
MPADLTRSLSAAVRGRVVSEPTGLAPFRHDASHLEGRPLAVVAPRDPDDVVELVRWARRTRTALVARGGGTSLDGESVPTDGSVVVDLSGWSRLIEVDPDGLFARVEPGVVNLDLQRALRPHGVFFPPNPGSWNTSTIGGNVGTNASGPRSFRYGPTRAWVREVEAVLGTGARVHLGSRVAKRSVGPDLLQWFVGSEGTLGIATEVTVRLSPIPSVRRGVVVPVSRTTRLGHLAARLGRIPSSGLSAVEYLDRECSAGIVERRGARWPRNTALLLLEVEAENPAEATRRLARLRVVLAQTATVRGFAVFEDADELWTLRGASGEVLIERFGHHVREDVAVPLSRVDKLVGELEHIARRENVPFFLFGHLGEGSLHPNYAVDPTTRVADRIRTAVLRASRSLGGTISSEHGVGSLKRRFLTEEVGENAVELLWAMKRACDPDGILNPGKLYPPSRRGAARRPSRSPSDEAGARTRTGSPNDGRRSVSRSRPPEALRQRRAAPP